MLARGGVACIIAPHHTRLFPHTTPKMRLFGSHFQGCALTTNHAFTVTSRIEVHVAGQRVRPTQRVSPHTGPALFLLSPRAAAAHAQHSERAHIPPWAAPNTDRTLQPKHASAAFQTRHPVQRRWVPSSVMALDVNRSSSSHHVNRDVVHRDVDGGSSSPAPTRFRPQPSHIPPAPYSHNTHSCSLHPYVHAAHVGSPFSCRGQYPLVCSLCISVPGALGCMRPGSMLRCDGATFDIRFQHVQMPQDADDE